MKLQIELINETHTVIENIHVYRKHIIPVDMRIYLAHSSSVFLSIDAL